jgi:Zn finger protein HypA/HybF involved in hydrogenase expression
MSMVRRTKDGGSHEIIGDDPLDKVWACLDCYWKGRLGECDVDYSCPQCRGTNVQAADGAEYKLERYSGEIGTVN